MTTLFPCPTCGAAVGMKCFNRWGAPIRYYHPTRASHKARKLVDMHVRKQNASKAMATIRIKDAARKRKPPTPG